MENNLSGGKNDIKGSKNTKFILALAALGVIIVVVVVLLLVLLPKKDQPEETGGSETPVVTVDDGDIEAEELRVTEETLKNIVDVNIEGYKKVDDNEISSDIVAVSIKNKSDQKVSIEVMIGAYDEDDALMEVSSLYAENSEPGVTQEFQLFPYTNLTPEQLQTATYKVYRAKTYVPDPNAGQPVTEESDDDGEAQE